MKEATKYIEDYINNHGSMDIGTFMDTALCHTEWGYYITRDPFGSKGDFVTAPEISQMFGEIIGAWVVDVWEKLGAPDKFCLVECGPGRGTLMSDILRASSAYKKFHDAVDLFLIEASPYLRNEQGMKLADYNPVWLDSISDSAITDSGVPVIVIGNEFLDALPIRQLQMTSDGWKERVLVKGDNKLDISLSEAQSDILGLVPEDIKNVGEGSIFEVSPSRSQFAETICKIIKRNKGAALFIDYGHVQTSIGDTFQAVRKHDYVSPFTNIGESDLTSHVDFAVLKKIAENTGISCAGPVGQGDFLHALGISYRASILSNKASPEQQNDIENAMNRLCGEEEMGKLFKVISFYHGDMPHPAGF
jgi:NADH dehydrogenase [ubiquinone] 1 alpha subcomplex assembly factor 7